MADFLNKDSFWNLLNAGTMGSESTLNSQFPGFSSQAPMTPEQQAFLQSQQQDFLAFQQTLKNIQQNPPQQQSQSSNSIPQQIDSQPKRIRVKHAAKRSKEKEAKPMGDVATLRWSSNEEALLAECFVAVSEDRNVGRSQAKDTGESEVDLWAEAPGRTTDRIKIHRFNPKLVAIFRSTRKIGYRTRIAPVIQPKDDTGDFTATLTTDELFGADPRPRPPGKQRPGKKPKSDTSASTRGSQSSQFGLSFVSHELRLKREAAKKVFEASKDKDETIKSLEELRFLALSTKDFWRTWFTDEEYGMASREQRAYSGTVNSKFGAVIVLSECDWGLSAKKNNTVSLTAGGDPAIKLGCESYTSRGAVGAWQSWILSSVGPGLITYCVTWACDPVDTIPVPYAFLVRLLARESSQLFIFPSFHRSMRGLDTCLDLNVCAFFLRRDLDQHCATFGIPAELRPELPDRNAIIKDSPEGKIGMYTRFIEFANYRIHLSKFLLCVLEYYHINLSQLSVIGAAKIDASVCPLSTSWFNGTSVVKDPLPVDEAVDLPCMELLNENLTLIRKYPETFLCLVGLRRSFIETDFHPTLLYDNDEEMGLLDFVKSADPFKVKVGERTLADNKVPLNTKTRDKVISPSAQTISLVDHTIQDELNVNSGKRRKRVAFVSGSSPVKKARAEGIVIFYSRPSTTGKSPTALRRLSRQNEQADTGSGSAAPSTEDVTSSSVTPTPERVLKDASHDNVRTRLPFGRFVVLSSGSADIDIPASPQVVPRMTSALTGVNAPVTEFVGDGHRSSSSGPIKLYNLAICQKLLDHVTPPGYLGRALPQEKFEKKFIDSAAIVQQRDAEIADLKARLEKSEAEAAEVIELRKRMSDLEATVAVKVDELANFHTENVGLVKRVSALELERDGLKNQVVGENKMREEFASQQDATERHFMERATELDARIADGLEAGVVHGKAGRSLTQIEAYDPAVEGKYVATVSEFEGVSFPLLDELESFKDSPIALIMSALTLKDGQGNKDTPPKFSRFQHSLDQVTVPIYFEFGSIGREMPLSDAIPATRESAKRRGLCPPSGFTLGGAFSSVTLPGSSLGVADYQVSTLVLAGDGGSANQPPATQSHDDLFDTSVLDKPGDV
ncbi:hypothetical protein Tco_0753619 [Tanacetum coccineum]